MRSILLVLLLALAGCTASASQMRAPDGAPIWAISCNGGANSLQACFRKADDVCPSGYRLLDTEQERSGTEGAGLLTGMNRTVYVACEP